MRERNLTNRPVIISYTEDDRLQSCPLCGRPPQAYIVKNIFGQTAKVGCTHCPGSINIEHPAKYEGDIEAELIERWNNYDKS
ncbi:MAG: hypothetical protein IKY90_08875 [Oscillospiraceae bacterium]|nr:hypothetical protein [Oscillospiraceae bacterium]